MFFFFSIFSRSIQQPEYSLIPPLQNTDIGEIGNWTIIQTATNLKNRIRLTSAYPGSYGAICQRVPTLFKEWAVELELSASNENPKDRPGQGIWFYYTDEVCPSITLSFNGFAFWVNTSSTDENGYSNVYFAKGNGTELLLEDLKPVGKTRIRDPKKPMKLQITKRFDRLTVDATKDIVFERIVDEDVRGTPDYGYFTISAATNDRVDNNDVISMRVYSMSSVDHPNKTFDFSSVNKEYIEKNKKERREMKKRRHEDMPLSIKYLTQSKDSNKKLNARDSENLEDAISIVSEAYERSKQAITADQLERFIMEGVDAAVTQAINKIETAHQRYSDIRQDVDELWTSLKRELIDIAQEEKHTLAQIEEEIIKYAKSLNLSQHDTKSIKHNLKNEASTLSDAPSTNILMIISFIEITAYVIFFLYQRYKTDDFKKRD